VTPVEQRCRLLQRRQFLLLTIGSASLLAQPGIAAAQSAPGKQIRFIVPFPAGGPTDIVARPLAQMLGDALKSTVVVENRGGAGGSLGADAVAKSAPDGQTLLMATVGTHAINSALYSKLPYDAVRDFTPIALVATAPVAIVVHPSLPVNSVAELVALAKKMPGRLNYGSAGAGTPGHLSGEMFKTAAGIDLQHVPYKGSAPAVTDLIGGQIQIMFDPLQSVLSNIQAGRLRAIAVTSKGRLSVLPNVPTVAESGYGDFETTAWWGVFAPANLPAAAAVQLAGEIERIARSDAFRGRLEPLGVTPTTLSGAEFAAFQRNELAKWGKAVRDSGASVD
jgi:tripartite-type tricarboxylate transporter receptor subunit TctC